MKRQSAFSLLTHPFTVALGIAALFSIRFLNCLPFSGFTRGFNYETVSTLTSFFIYAREPFSFPLGSIKALTFPFEDANVGNVGAIPLFAMSFKALGKIFPYFQTFDYFVLLEILSCFLTAFFAQKVLVTLGVHRTVFRALGALLMGTSFLLLTRSGWLQPFCVVAFPLFTAWIYAMLLTLQRGTWSLRQDFGIVSLFLVAALMDNYSLFGILLATSALLVREFFEALFGGLSTSWNRFSRILFFCAFGSALSVLALYAIGMFPLPPVPRTFTSYDFGMGGRYHVADLFAPWIPVANKVSGFPEASLLGRLGFPLNTDHLGSGQYEGVAYVGTPILLLWLSLAVGWLFSLRKNLSDNSKTGGPIQTRFVLYPPWKKVSLAALVVFVFSLGYELIVFGQAFPNFSGMPAAWIADRFPAVYNIRATGRLASLLSLFLIIEGIRLLYVWYEKIILGHSPGRSTRFPYLGLGAVGVLVTIHFIEVTPFLRPVPAQPLHPIGSVFSDVEIGKLRSAASHHDTVLISPSVRAVDAKWTTEAYSLAYYLGLRSNIYYLARTDPDHDVQIARDLARVTAGDWDALADEYGRVLFAIPSARSEELRARMRDRYQEMQVGTVSLWSKREGNSQTENQFGRGKQK